MKVMTTKDYENKKIEFLHKHNDWKVITSPINKYGQYHKTYICTDDAVWTEVIEPIYEMAEFEVHGIKFSQEVKLLRTEGWSTDDATSIYCYEKY